MTSHSHWKKKIKKTLRKGELLPSPSNTKVVNDEMSYEASDPSETVEINPDPKAKQPSPGGSLCRPMTRGYEREQLRERKDHFYDNSYFILHKESLEALINDETFKDHTRNCEHNVKLNVVDRIMISNTLSIKCSGCDYESPAYELFERMESDKRGMKRSTLNHGFGNGLVRSRIQAAQATEILLHMGVLAGSERGITKVCGQSSDRVANEADKVMEDQVEALVGEVGVKASTDAVYNNPLGGDPNNPMQRGKVRVNTMVVHTERGPKITSMVYDNKNCHEGSRLMRLGLIPKCPDHPNCTATVSQDTPISREGDDMAAHAANMQGVDISEICTDGDGGVGPAIKQHFGETVKHTHDFRHVSRSMIGAIQKLVFTKGAFGPKTTKKAKAAFQRKFASDLTSRVNAEIISRVQNLEKNMDSNAEEFLPTLAEDLRKIPEVVIQCVSSDCGMECTNNSNICIGGLHRRHKRQLMGPKKLNLTKNDKAKLIKVIQSKKTGIGALTDSLPSSSTQINEATNQGILKSWPKSSTFTKTLDGRIKSYSLDKNIGKAAAGRVVTQAAQHKVSPAVEAEWAKLEYRQKYHAKKQQEPKIKWGRKTKYLTLH